MLVKEIKSIAKEMEISPGKMNKTNLVKAIQKKEGNYPCFASGVTDCDQVICLWRKDCLK